MAAEHTGAVRGHSEIESQILFPSRAESPLKYRRDAVHIAHKLNMTLFVAKVITHIRIHRLNYNGSGKLGGIMASASIRSMLLQQHRELVLKAARQLDQDITDTTGDQK